jgi:hypothetical protein
MAGLIPPEKLEQIRAASDIVEIIGSSPPDLPLLWLP